MPRFPHQGPPPSAEETQAFLKRFNADVATRGRRDIELYKEMGWPKVAAHHERQIAARSLAAGETEAAQTGATVGIEATGETIVGAEAAGETLVGAAVEGGLAAGGTVGAAGGFEIPVWGWIATGVAAVGGVGYGIYKHYQHKREAEIAAQKQGTVERRHFNKAQLIETQHIVAGTATVREVKDVQRELKAEGFDIGEFGTRHDGVDGVAGRFTQKALAASMKRLGSGPSSSL
jgi:hypothetical protein